VVLMLVLILLFADSADARATAGWRMGSSVPMTIYLRTQRQARGFFDFGEHNTEDEEVHDVSAASPAKEEMEEAAAEMLQPLSPDVLLAQHGGGVHRNQIRRQVPPSHGPRFGISKHAELPLGAWIRAAARELNTSTSREVVESALAIRLSLGRDFRKETTWIPLATRRHFISRLHLLTFAQRNRVEAEDAEGRGDVHGNDIYVLHRLHLFFGFKSAEVHNRLTFFRVEYEYAPFDVARGVVVDHLRPFMMMHLPPNLVLHNHSGQQQQQHHHHHHGADVEISYVWDEHQKYNPARAITLTCAVSISAGLGLLGFMLSHNNSRASRLFRRQVVAVSHHDD